MVVKTGVFFNKSKKHKLRKMRISQKALKNKFTKKHQQSEQTIQELKIENQTEDKIVGKNNENKQLPTHFTNIKGIEPIYSGGKISVNKSKDDKVLLYTKIKKLKQQNMQEDNKNKNLKGDEDIANFAVSNDGEYLATFTRNYLLRYMHQNQQIVFTQKVEPLFPINMGFSPEDIFLALGCTNGTIRIINVKKQTIMSEYRYHQSSVLKVAWIPIIRKLQLASAGDDQKIIIYDVVLNKCLCQINAHAARITSLSFSYNGNYLYSSSADCLLKVWDVAQYKQIDEMAFENDIESMLVVQRKKKEFILVGCQNGSFYQVNQEKQIKKYESFNDQEILKIMLGPNQKVYVITNELHIYILNLEDLQIEQCILGYNDEILDVKFITDDKIVMATNSTYLKEVDLNTMNVVAWKAHDDIVMCLDTFGSTVYSGAKDNLVKIWKDRQLIQTLQGHDGSLIGVSVFQGKLLASVGTDSSLKLWNLSNTKESKGNVIAHEKVINCVKFAPNGKMIGTSSHDRTIKIWRTKDLMLTMTLQGHKRGVWDIAFSPVEKVIASVSGDNSIKLWNLDNGTVISSLEGHQSSLHKISWMGLGLILISSDSKGVMKLWNVKKQKCINTFEKHEGKVWALDHRRDYLVSGGNDSLLLVWKNTAEEENKKVALEQQKKQIKLQEYQNLIQEQKYKEAAILAFENNYIKHFIDAAQKIENFGNLSQCLIHISMLKYLNILNTLNQSNKTCVLAQNLLNNAIQTVKFEIKKEEKVLDLVKELLRKLRYSTQKYLERIKGHISTSHLVEYTLDKYNVLQPI